MFSKMIDAQYRRPTGLLGRWIGGRMARDHRAENLWTLSILEAQPTDQVLEIGFGPGFAVQELVRVIIRGRISGVDFSKTMLVAEPALFLCRPGCYLPGRYAPPRGTAAG